jgi:RNA polymerase sigma-70 factor (ECF subfamily)
VAGPSDSELLHRARAGDAAAFEALIRRHDKHLYRIARSVLPHDQEAEDIVQETYIRAFMGLPGFRGAASLRTWLTRIALNEAVRRTRGRRSMLEIGAVHDAQERSRRPLHTAALTALGRDPEHAAAQAQIRGILERAIDDLPAAFRTVFVMRDVEDINIGLTAKLLGIREETVKTRLHRARRLLREKLGEQFAAALKDVFPFEKPRCDALIRRIWDQLGFSPPIHLSREGTG